MSITVLWWIVVNSRFQLLNFERKFVYTMLFQKPKGVKLHLIIIVSLIYDYWHHLVVTPSESTKDIFVSFFCNDFYLEWSHVYFRWKNLWASLGNSPLQIRKICYVLAINKLSQWWLRFRISFLLFDSPKKRMCNIVNSMKWGYRGRWRVRDLLEIFSLHWFLKHELDEKFIYFG